MHAIGSWPVGPYRYVCWHPGWQCRWPLCHVPCLPRTLCGCVQTQAGIDMGKGPQAGYGQCSYCYSWMDNWQSAYGKHLSHMMYIGCRCWCQAFLESPSAQRPAPFDYCNAATACRSGASLVEVYWVDNFFSSDIYNSSWAGQCHFMAFPWSDSQVFFSYCMMPTFLDPGSGRVQLAQMLLSMLPPELMAIGEPEEMVTEYLHYWQFFIIWDTLSRVVECQALDVPGMMKDTQTGWLREYQVCFMTPFAIHPQTDYPIPFRMSLARLLIR